MSWSIDKAKLDRVRTLMKDQDISALVVPRAGQRSVPHQLLVHEGIRCGRVSA